MLLGESLKVVGSVADLVTLGAAVKDGAAFIAAHGLGYAAYLHLHHKMSTRHARRSHKTQRAHRAPVRRRTNDH